MTGCGAPWEGDGWLVGWLEAHAASSQNFKCCRAEPLKGLWDSGRTSILSKMGRDNASTVFLYLYF